MTKYKKKYNNKIKISIFIMILSIAVVLLLGFKQSINRETYKVDLKKFNISKNNTNPTKTTEGINKAIKYAKENGYKTIKLPKGHYSIDTSVTNPIELKDKEGSTWTHNRQGIVMESDLTLDLTDCTLEMVPVEDPYYSIITVSNCKNSTIIGGTIIGDRNEHDYGMRVNEDGNEFKSGDIDAKTGKYKKDKERVVTKDYIYTYVDWFSKNEEELPKQFAVIPLWNTTMNTVDGGCAYVYCYDENNKYLGVAEGGDGYATQRTLIEGTKKIKISLRGEKRLDPVISLTTRDLYQTYEFGTGIVITASDSIEINGTTVKDCIGDCIGTSAPPLKVTVDNLKIVDCTLENSRRQGISFVATGENYVVKDCNIGNINGVDPQCGIDFEHYDYMKNTVIEGCNFYDNKKWDIINYNGTDIEVKNSNFTGAIATTYGKNMDIHNNVFKYRDSKNKDKIFKETSLALGTENNIVYDNEFIGGSVSNSGANSKTYNNIFRNAKADITSDGVNKYYNSEVGIRQNESFAKLENNYFENCEVFNHNDEPSIEINKCTFENSSYNAKGETIINDSTFNLSDKSLMNGWMTEATNITYNNCIINSSYEDEINLLGEGINTKATFNKCKFDISRYTIALNYGTLNFNSCEFKFNDLNKDKGAVELNRSGYGFEECPWNFNKCTFESSLPVNVYDNVKDCKVIGKINIIL